jgi:hypothetical protein
VLRRREAIGHAIGTPSLLPPGVSYAVVLPLRHFGVSNAVMLPLWLASFVVSVYRIYRSILRIMMFNDTVHINIIFISITIPFPFPGRTRDQGLALGYTRAQESAAGPRKAQLRVWQSELHCENKPNEADCHLQEQPSTRTAVFHRGPTPPARCPFSFFILPMRECRESTTGLLNRLDAEKSRY